MKRVLLLVMLGTGHACASNGGSHETGARIRDTTMTARDTTTPEDTLPRVRDSVPDTPQ
jgi:hypothetical protein